MNPWNNPNLIPVKFLSIDTEDMSAEIQTTNGRITVPVNISPEKLADIYETGAYGDTAFLNEYSEMVGHSTLSIWNGTLTPIGGEIYE